MRFPERRQPGSKIPASAFQLRRREGGRGEKSRARNSGPLARYHPGIMLAIFGLVHGLYALAGLRYDAYPLTHFWQYLDPELLKTRLAQSLFYLHSQPPLFNLFLGTVLKVAGDRYWAVFQTLYLAAGFGIYAGTAALMRRLGVSRVLALGLSTLFMASPSFVLYEHWLFYTLPLALILVLSALALANVLERARPGDIVAFCGSLLLLGGTRSLYQLPYLVAVMVAVILVHPARRLRGEWARSLREQGVEDPLPGTAGRLRAIPEGRHKGLPLPREKAGSGAGQSGMSHGNLRVLILVSALTTVLLLSIYLKNLALFGRFSSSSWLGMNLWGMIDRDLPQAEREALVAAGQVSELALIPRFSPPEDYPAKYGNVPGYDAIPALVQTRKSTGAVNYNHIAFLGISDQYFGDALQVIRLRPRTFLIGVAKSWFNYFKPGSDNVFLESNLAAVAPLRVFYDHVFFGKLPFDLARIPSLPLNNDDPRHLYLFLVAGLPLLTVYALALALRTPPWRRSGSVGLASSPLDGNQRWVVLYICLTVIYVACIGNLFEIGENNRFRVETDPFFVVMLGLLFQYAVAPRASPAAQDSRGDPN